VSTPPTSVVEGLEHDVRVLKAECEALRSEVTLLKEKDSRLESLIESLSEIVLREKKDSGLN